jgi:membrane protease YdiL (CAAX protease family)
MSSIPKFVIVLKNEKLKTYTVISWLIIALNFVSFIYFGITKKAAIDSLPYFAAGLLLCFFVIRWLSNRETIENEMISISFTMSVVAWIIMQFYWIAAVTLILFLFQEISRRTLTIMVFENGILYPSFPKRHIEWSELNNVILKDGLLTIDLKSNRLLQNESISVVYEPDFNEFCKSHLQPV